jgi:hypothetical protein
MYQASCLSSLLLWSLCGILVIVCCLLRPLFLAGGRAGLSSSRSMCTRGATRTWGHGPQTTQVCGLTGTAGSHSVGISAAIAAHAAVVTERKLPYHHFGSLM